MIAQFQGEYRWLSNFAECPILLDGIIYNSVERAYMSAKSTSSIEIELEGHRTMVTWKTFCQIAKTNGIVKKQSYKMPLVDGWDDKKQEVMFYCLKRKFQQEPYRSKLIATGNTHIQEGNHWGDVYWGVDLKTGKGLNILGRMIMQIRENIGCLHSLEFSKF